MTTVADLILNSKTTNIYPKNEKEKKKKIIFTNNLKIFSRMIRM